MRVLRVIGWFGIAVLAVLAIAGIAISAVSLLAATPFGRRFVASELIRLVDAQVAGSLELGGVEVLPSGGIVLRELRVIDPDGHLVLAVGRAKVLLDVTGVGTRTLGASLELDSPTVLLEQEPGGGVSLARAFAPSHPSPPGPETPGRGGAGFAWTVHVPRLAIRGGEIWWVDADGGTRLEARDIDVDGRGTFGPDRARAELRVRGRAEAPLDAPVSLDLVASRSGVAVHLPVLRAEIGGNALAAVGEGDLAQRTFRVAVSRLAVDRADVREVVPRAPGGADLRATAYAESDGRTVTAAVHAEPEDAGRAGGLADVALATPLAAIGSALGFDVAIDRLDPSRLAAGAPAGDVTLAAHGGASGLSAGRLADLRGRVSVSVSRSRLRRGEVTRAEIAARADHGVVQIDRLSAAVPGADVDGGGTWRQGGAVSGSFGAQVRDAAVLARDVASLLGEKRPIAVAGRASVRATLGGTSAAPALSASIDAPWLRVGGVVASGASVVADVGGLRSAPEGRVVGRVAALGDGARTIARAVTLQASLAGEEASISATGSVPGGGTERYAIDGRGRFGPRREALDLSDLAIAWPGTRFRLVQPARLQLRGGPSVDRLELAAGPQRLAVTGGLGRRGALDARIEVSRLDVAHLPEGLLPVEGPVAGELGVDARATGTTARPQVDARLTLANGAFRDLAGLDAVGEAQWDGRARRATASLSLARRGGGTVDLSADVPLPLGARPAERIAARIRAGDVPVHDVLVALGADARLAGTLSFDAVLEGRAGAPALRGQATLDEAAFGDLDGLALWISAEDGGERLRVGAGASQQGRSVLAVDAGVPLDLADLLARPGAALRAARAAPVEASVAVTGLDLALVAGRAGAPDGIAGLVDADAALSGTLGAPRGRATVELSHAAWSGYRGIAAHVDAALGAGEVATAGRIAVSGEEALRFTASLGAPVERLASRDVFRRVPLRAEAIVPSLALARAATEQVPLSGDIQGRLTASGTPGAPEVALDLSGRGIAVEGRPLGEASVRARYAGGRATAEVDLRPAAGGELRGTIAVRADVGLGAGGVPLREAPAEASVVADALDLGFLPAALPTLVRTASGKLSLDVRASGPLARLSPRGTLHVENGAVAVTELGEWTGIAVDASVTADAIELSRLEVHRGSGRVTAHASLRGLTSSRAVLDAHLTSDAFSVTRAGMELATITVTLDATGSYASRTLAVEARIPRGVVRLPNRTPRTLQSLDHRSDIVIGSRTPRPPPRAPPAGTRQAEPSVGSPPLTVEVHAVAPRQLFVVSDDPKVDIELKADVRYQRVGSEDYADGSVEVVRGTVDPIAGRTFTLQRGRVQFTGGPPTAAMLDVEATYDNPAAKVTVDVAGPLAKPEIRLSSQPPLDDSQIAMLIATGQTEVKPGAGGVGTLSGEEAGKAALSVLATQAFKNLVAKKLPLDTVALDPSALRAGKYVTDKIYVAYTRRFEADPAKGQNENEVRVEYTISPHWTFESRYGNAGSGGASLIWSRNY